MNKIEIPLSRKKILLGIVGSLLMVSLSIFAFTVADYQTRYSPTLMKMTGILGALFFLATGIYGCAKTFDAKLGLIIDDSGILDNTNAASVGLIRWPDITKITTEKVASTRFLLVYVTNPEAYIKNTNGLKRKLMEGNYKMYGTPLSINSNTLKCNFSTLEKLLNDKFDVFKHNLEGR